MISGICSICGSTGFIRTCRLCGTRVCSRHFDSGKDVCVRCSGGGVKGVEH